MSGRVYLQVCQVQASSEVAAPNLGLYDGRLANLGIMFQCYARHKG